MDYQYANLCCVLKVHPRCDACKRHTMEVLSSLDGVYDVTIDAETKTAKIAGQVDPNYCIKALSRCGVHAELLWANLSHPRMNRSSYDYYDYDYTEPYGHRRRRSLPEGMWHEGHHHYPMRSSLPEYSYHHYPMRNSLPEYSYHHYPMRNSLPEYSYNGNYYHDGARNVPLYHPRIECLPYVGDESMNYCSIL
ncbi:Copper chaperone [Handroanthus impetiginosus]|uniref:Copper chaperone n=1 Tax=Handroanthus impetiginosus TaxID=429701 RepID=A0A2G9GVS4_9LAMI|nr:Copper chaperone [Handroanthus impetiginosus]